MKKERINFETATKTEGSEEQSEAVTGHLVTGAWTQKTLKGYSSAVQKYKTYIESTGREFKDEDLFLEKDVYGFIVWAGPSEVEKKVGPKKEIKSKTIEKYLAGLRAWHMAKHHKELKLDKQMVDWLIKSTERAEEKKTITKDTIKKEKVPITVQDLFQMVAELNGKSSHHDLAVTIALVAFWGMARLGEMLRERVEDGAIKVEDLSIKNGKRGKIATLRLWKAKTAKPGEVQIIR